MAVKAFKEAKLHWNTALPLYGKIYERDGLGVLSRLVPSSNVGQFPSI